uniref:Rhodanese domain-containing protein n=1 Tax=viral metagenome TaxID=1070528 RepID=A0A6C0LNR0_9ZZZZ
MPSPISPQTPLSPETLRDYLRSTKDDWNYITPIDFYNKYYLKRNNVRNAYYLIDLRSNAEYKKGHVKGSKNIYWLHILDEENLKKLPKNKTIFLICYVGHTSSQVLTLLKLLGYNVISIKYGYGLSPVKHVPVAGWLDYGLPLVASSSSK